MKQLMLVMLCAITLNSTAQSLSLKDYTLGNKYYGESLMENQTVGGLSGVILVSTLNDDRIYGVGFLPKDRVSYSDFKAFKSGVEKNYGVKLKWHSDDSYSDNGRWISSSNRIIISYKENEYMDQPVEMMFILRDPKLVEINAKEEAVKASQQFK